LKAENITQRRKGAEKRGGNQAVEQKATKRAKKMVWLKGGWWDTLASYY
jgi:hypothetical protein